MSAPSTHDTAAGTSPSGLPGLISRGLSGMSGAIPLPATNFAGGPVMMSSGDLSGLPEPGHSSDAWPGPPNTPHPCH